MSAASPSRWSLLTVALIAGMEWGAATLDGAPPTSSTGADVLIPGGDYVPFSKGVRDAAHVHVAPFLMDEYPVTNAEFFKFVQGNPKWKRSRVSRLFADSTYLADWAGDDELGAKAPDDSAVVHVSWFAARAYARWRGKRLPNTTEWEYAASAGYTQLSGKSDFQLNRDLYAWLARPDSGTQPSVKTAKPNFYGVRGLHCLVWEWVEDFNTALDVGGDNGGDQNLFCAGGASNVKDSGDYAAFMRQALRSSLKANNTTSSLGFRCARSVEPVAALLTTPTD